MKVFKHIRKFLFLNTDFSGHYCFEYAFKHAVTYKISASLNIFVSLIAWKVSENS